MRLLLFIAGAILCAAPIAAQPQADARPLDHLRIVAPAAPGGGWDQTARVMQQVLVAEGLARVVQVENVAGAAGTIGLARFIKGTRRDEAALLVTGLVMQSAIVANQAPVSLGRVTPIARLTGEYEVVVVPAASPLRTLADLVAELRRDPGRVSWAGGSAGGTDQILVSLLARAAGVPPSRANYVAFSGGGESLAALLGHQVSAGVAGYSEFAPHVAAGSLRAIAISAPDRLPGIAAPTFVEQGYDLVLANWRGVVGPPNATPALKRRLQDVVDRLRGSEAWRDALTRHDWMDLYLPADAFEPFLEREQTRVESIILSLRSGADVAPLARTGASVFPAVVGIGLLVVGVALVVEARRSRARAEAPAAAGGSVRSVVWLAGGVVASLATLETAGFVVSSSILFWSTARAFGSARWLRDLVVGVALALAAYEVFTRGLSLSLPPGILSGWPWWP